MAELFAAGNGPMLEEIRALRQQLLMSSTQNTRDLVKALDRLPP